ncbi:MAG: DUF692 domain-containing protein, partial [Myxococcales bacterium]|nr:DUF692 domain-containing protein [Myxococcales bacterium]
MQRSSYGGHGISLRHEYYAELLADDSEHALADVDWVEVISENYFEPGGRPWRALERVRRDVPVVIHGVSLGVGNTDRFDERYIEQLRELVARIEPAAISDHLCWGAFGGHHSHDLLPLPFNEACVEHVVARVAWVQERLGCRLMLENVSSYLTYKQSTMSEAEFVAEVARRADCNILLDVNNIIVSAANHGFDPRAYVAALPAERIAHLHLAGHTDKGDYVLDSHVGPVPENVWSLYRHVVSEIGPRPTLVEWDDCVPPLAVVAREARR